jgi:uncharacterized protein YcfJ
MRNLAIGVAILSILPLLAEGAEVMHVKWENLSMVQGQTVRVFLPGGFVTGKAANVEGDALVVDVKKTSDPNTYPKGMLRVPREKLRRLEMQTKGKTGRILLTSLGTIVTGLTGYAVAEYGIDQCSFWSSYCPHGHSAGAGAAAFGITAVGVVGGYFAGNVLDKHWTAIEILP